MGEEKKEIIEQEIIKTIKRSAWSIPIIFGYALDFFLIYITIIQTVICAWDTQSESVYMVIPYDNGGSYEVGSSIAFSQVETTITGPYSTLDWVIAKAFSNDPPKTSFVRSLQVFGDIVTLKIEHPREVYIYKGIIGNSKIINDQYYNSSEIDVGGAYVLVISKVNPDSSIVGEWKLKEGED